MNRFLWFTIGAAAVIAVVVYVWSTNTVAPVIEPNIIVASPKGGEVWQVGDTHSILWTTQGVSPTDNISLTLRRIPPPPLQSEGQEFDPIVAVNLTNSGKYDWTISNMYPDGTYVLGVNAYTSVPITNEVSSESAAFTITQPKLLQDLYPLYSKVEWSAPGEETVTIATSTYSGMSINSVPITDTMNPESIFTPFENDYNQKLTALGWSVANDLAAGGHVGGQTGYRKGNEIVLVRFNTLYHSVTDTAPSECPCDVTLSLFSTN